MEEVVIEAGDFDFCAGEVEFGGESAEVGNAGGLEEGVDGGGACEGFV